MSHLIVLGIDPGLRHTGFCHYDATQRVAFSCESIDTSGLVDARRAIIAKVDEYVRIGPPLAPTIVALEDFNFRRPRVDHGLVKDAAAMGKLVGWLEAELPRAGLELVLVRPEDSKAKQPSGALAKKLGIPGTNDHQRSAFYAAQWLAGTLRLAGGVA